MLLLVLGGAVAQESENAGGLILGIACLLLIGGVIVPNMLLYKSWAVVQDSNPPTTPGKAVGLMFIPFFNFYWQFVAIYDLAKHVNRYCAERNIAAPRVNQGLAIAVCLINCIAWGLFPHFITVIPALVLTMILWKSFTEATIAIVTSNQSMSPSSA